MGTGVQCKDLETKDGSPTNFIGEIAVLGAGRAGAYTDKSASAPVQLTVGSPGDDSLDTF